MGVTIPGPSGEVKESYEISNSLRFNDGDSPQLNLANEGTVTNNKIFTYSVWIKKSSIESANQSIISAESGNNRAQLLFRSSSNDAIRIVETSDAYSSFNTLLTTASLFRDPSAWYHIVLSYDSTDGTAGDRVKIYVNSVLQTLSGTTADSNFTTPFNEESYNLDIGHLNNSEFLDGHMSDAHFIDGQALTPTSFGETNDNGVWIPKRYTGSYGLNGFKLEFKQTGTSTNSSGIGADTSGNDRHFAVSNLAATDVTEDTPTNNFATLNPLDRAVENASGGIVLSEGNCEAVGVNGGNRSRAQSTIGFSSGKWYAEFKIKNGNDHKTQIGMIDEVQSTNNHGGVNAGVEYRTNDDAIYSFTDGSENSGQTGLSGISNDDIVGVAINADTSPPSIQFYVNGSTKGTAVTYPNTGSIYFFFVRDGSDSGNDEPHVVCNFGNIPSTVSSPNTDGKYGKFYYAPPSGYYALCTKRLAEFG